MIYLYLSRKNEIEFCHMSDHDADKSYDQYDGSLDVRLVTAD
jgi:hypothetical protein